VTHAPYSKNLNFPIQHFDPYKVNYAEQEVQVYKSIHTSQFGGQANFIV
jgi:hypothetical protein